jgi:hypothetical protein
MAEDIYIAGVPFTAVAHHDGRFARSAGLFALAKRQPGGGYTVLHLEMTASISQSAAAHHSRWAWALAAGMDTLLIHMFGRAQEIEGSVTPDTDTVDWHPEAQVDFFGVDLDDAGDGLLATTIQVAGSVRRSGGGRDDA